MEITVVNLVVSCIITGYCTIKFGWEGMLGSTLGAILYYTVLRGHAPFWL